MANNAILQIACDEAGHTGPDLLTEDQRWFAYASTNLSDLDASNLLKDARALFPVQMPELKGSLLMKTSKGRALVRYVIESLDDKFIIVAQNKLLALCGWLFEYVYEPVIKYNPKVFYERNLHRFVAMFCYLWIDDQNSDMFTVINEFQQYLRTKDISFAPTLFDQTFPPMDLSGDAEPFELIMRFASGYKEFIKADNRDLAEVLPDDGKWVLDLSASALWSHLNYWGQYKKPLKVKCDVSKPIQAMAKGYRGDDNDPAIIRARHMGHDGPLGWTFADPIRFVDSKQHPSVQVADIIASASTSILSKGVPDDSKILAQLLSRRFLSDSILPDHNIIDTERPEAAVNFLALMELARRAEAQENPMADMEIFYRFAEQAVQTGKFS